VLLEREGFRAILAPDGRRGLDQAVLGKPTLILADLRLPDISGVEICKRLRTSGIHTPIIVLSAVGEEIDKVLLLEIGADDYVVKPFGIAELLARSESALRRYFKSSTESSVVSAGPLSVDLVTRSVLLNGDQIRLTRKEYRLVHILATHVGLVVTHDQLLKEIWSGNQRDNIQYLRILVRKLRQKIETDPNDPRLLITESGVGYRLQSRLETSPTD